MSPHADPHWRQPHPSALVFHDTLHFFPSPRSQVAAFSFSIGWRRKRFEDALGEDQKAFCAVGGCDGAVVGLPLLFAFPFPAFAARGERPARPARPFPCRDGGGEGGGMPPREGRVSDAVGMRALKLCKQLVTHCITMAPTACGPAAPLQGGGCRPFPLRTGSASALLDSETGWPRRGAFSFLPAASAYVCASGREVGVGSKCLVRRRSDGR